MYTLGDGFLQILEIFNARKPGYLMINSKNRLFWLCHTSVIHKISHSLLFESIFTTKSYSWLLIWKSLPEEFGRDLRSETEHFSRSVFIMLPVILCSFILLSESSRPCSEDHERNVCSNFRPVQPWTTTAHPQHAQPGSIQTASTEWNNGSSCMHQAPA